MSDVAVDSPYLALPLKFQFASLEDAEWVLSDRGALEQRDLRLGVASGDQMRAVEYRATQPGRLESWATASTLRFIFLYVTSGQVRFSMVNGAAVTLAERDVVHQPFLAGVASAEYSDDFKAVEVIVPDRPESELDPLLRFISKPLSGDWESGIIRNRPERFIPGDGPRAFFTYRNLGTDALTDRRIHIHDGLGATQPKVGGTGWHSHSMSQFFMALGGQGVLDIEGHGSFVMKPGDAIIIEKRMRHNVSSYTEGYCGFEICLPADYDTIDQPAPPQA